MKVGYQGALLRSRHVDRDQRRSCSRTGSTTASPNQFTFRLPDWQAADRTDDGARLFVQDTWTRGRLTLQGALRYDRAWSFSPAEGNGTTDRRRRSTRRRSRSRGPTASTRTTTSRRASARPTTCSATARRRSSSTSATTSRRRPTTAAYTLNNPAQTAKSSRRVSRNWTDTNGNNVVDCDILEPGGAERARQATPAGAHRQLAELRQDRRQRRRRSTRPCCSGWGVRPNDWQWGINVQQELMPRVSLDVGYNRRYFHWREAGGQGTVTDNVLVGPSDYTALTINAPIDARLPGGGGYPITMWFMTRPPRRAARKTTSRSRRISARSAPTTGTAWTSR